MNHKQEADKIIQEIIPIIDPDFGKVIKKVVYEKARKLAILQIQAILSLPSLQEGRMMPLFKSDYDHWQSILTQLEKL